MRTTWKKDVKKDIQLSKIEWTDLRYPEFIENVHKNLPLQRPKTKKFQQVVAPIRQAAINRIRHSNQRQL